MRTPSLWRHRRPASCTAASPCGSTFPGGLPSMCRPPYRAHQIVLAYQTTLDGAEAPVCAQCGHELDAVPVNLTLGLAPEPLTLDWS